MSDVRLIPKDELIHFGVKGMKWGHRKRQINDGLNAVGTRYNRSASGTYRAKVKNLRKERDAVYKKSSKEFQSNLKQLEKQGKINDQKSLDAVFKKYDDKTNAALNQYKAGKKQARGEAAQMRIDARGGSKGKAAAVSAGSMVARNMLRTVGASAIGTLSGSESVARGAMAAASLMNTADMVITGRNIYDISKR